MVFTWKIVKQYFNNNFMLKVFHGWDIVFTLEWNAP